MFYHGKDNNDYVNGAGFCCAGKNKKLQAYGGGIGKGNEEYEKIQHYDHADHLGSNSYITNLDAQILVIDLNMKIEVKLSDKTSPVIQ